MSVKVVKCSRCGKRHHGNGDWNIEYIAGLVVGHTCPECQTTDDHLGAEISLVLSPPSGWEAVKMGGHDAVIKLIVKLINGLLDAYPTPAILHAQADRLAAARKDVQASEMVRLMRMLADDDDLWDENGDD